MSKALTNYGDKIDANRLTGESNPLQRVKRNDVQAANQRTDQWATKARNNEEKDSYREVVGCGA
ncbi:hypothetical protein Mag101_06730 [Microbulbifer agarilyticus]|uniref:Uncharacterized protein n=1 Tax=Microbulbifer agarilyticus TaxID=260552 RepID=A0A1Q2M3T3_9GAMM|nr:hypothetical protein Mag101_06730 [Microbulbifer agarilyticus]